MAKLQTYPIVYVDPAWKYNDRNNPATKFGSGMNQYTGMALGEICALPVDRLAADNAALFLWGVSPYLEHVFHVMRAWNFRYVTKAFSWVKVDKEGKPRFLPGHYTGSNTEDCFLGIRGKMAVHTLGLNQILDDEDLLSAPAFDETIISRLERHSKKPASARARIVELFGDLPRVELFARETAPGWKAYGLDIDGQRLQESLRPYAIVPKVKRLRKSDFYE